MGAIKVLNGSAVKSVNKSLFNFNYVTQMSLFQFIFAD